MCRHSSSSPEAFHGPTDAPPDGEDPLSPRASSEESWWEAVDVAASAWHADCGCQYTTITATRAITYYVHHLTGVLTARWKILVKCVGKKWTDQRYHCNLSLLDSGATRIHPFNT